MYAAAHTAVALAAKKHNPTAPLLPLMVTAQATELLWIALSYTGVERSTVDASNTLHLDQLPYSHSLLTGLGGGVVLWALLRFAFRRPQIAAVFGWVFASHIVLDVIQHEPDIQVLPWMTHPRLGFNLQASPVLDFAVETALCIGCWFYYRGTIKLLLALIALNLTNLPLMFAGDGGAKAMAGNQAILPTVILATIVLAWVVTYHWARGDKGAAATAARHHTPATA